MDERIRNKVTNLKLRYGKHPQKELLIAIPNPCPDRDYEEAIVSSEFSFATQTCLFAQCGSDSFSGAGISCFNILYIPYLNGLIITLSGPGNTPCRCRLRLGPARF